MISLSKLRAEIGSSAGDDAKVETLRAQVLALWDSATLREWGVKTGVVETYTRGYDDDNSIYLKTYPVTALTLVRTKGYTSTSWRTLTTCVVINDNQLLNHGGSYENLVEVTYTGGVVTAPEDIAQVLILQAKFMLERNGVGKLGVRSQNFEGGGGVYEEATYHPMFKLLAKKYKRIV